MRRARTFGEKSGERGEINIRERVAGDHQERLVQHIAGERDAPGGAQRAVLVGVGDVEPELLARSEVVLDDRPEVVERDDDVGDPVVLEQPQDVLDGRGVAQGDHGLGPLEGERTQARAFAAGHDDRLHAGSPGARRDRHASMRDPVARTFIQV